MRSISRLFDRQSCPVHLWVQVCSDEVEVDGLQGLIGVLMQGSQGVVGIRHVWRQPDDLPQ